MNMRIAVKGIQENAKTCGRELLYVISEKKEFVLLYLLFLLGTVFGVFYAKNAGFGAISRMDFLFAGNFKARITQSFVNLFAASFASSFLFIFLCFLCGLSLWGMFFIPFVLVFRGFGLGLTSGYLYAVYTGKGVLFNFSVLLPGAFVCCISLLLAAKEGIHFSRSLVSQHSGSSATRSIRIYILHFGAILGISFFAAIIDVLLSACFGGLFSFT